MQYDRDVTVEVAGTGERMRGAVMKCSGCEHSELWAEMKVWGKVKDLP